MMNKNYTAVLWMNDYRESLDSQVERIYSSMNKMGKVDYLIPKYLPANSKAEVTEFVFSVNNVKDMIITNIDEKFNDLGSRFSFFTSMNDDKMCGISFSTGIKNEQFVNTVVVNIKNQDYDNTEKAEEISSLFLKLVEINKPFYACLTENENKSLHGPYMKSIDGVPSAVLWVNYFGETIATKLSIAEKMIDTNIEELCEIRKLNDGYYIRLQESPINNLSEEQLSNQKKINSILGLM
jgi:hypothetical protein